MRRLDLAVLIALAAFPAQAADVAVTGAWFRALPAGLPGGGYFNLRNLGGSEIVLTGASSPACGMLMLHKSVNENGVSSMADVSTIDVPAGGQVSFAPGGYHLMCMQPALKPGTAVPVTLSFADGTKTTAQFAVKNAAGR